MRGPLSAEMPGAPASSGEPEVPPPPVQGSLAVSKSSAQLLTGITSTLRREKRTFRKVGHVLVHRANVLFFWSFLSKVKKKK